VGVLTGEYPHDRLGGLGGLGGLGDGLRVERQGIGATYPLDQVPQALRYLEAGQARGKVVITI
jgi:Zinc-binding dehydrogenase